MYDEQQRLRDNPHLGELLAQYVPVVMTEDDSWLDRRMSLEGVEPKELVKLHGELLAFGWVEQNTGVVTVRQRGECPRCYRVTTAGRRALKRHLAEHDEDVAEAA